MPSLILTEDYLQTKIYYVETRKKKFKLKTDL